MREPENGEGGKDSREWSAFATDNSELQLVIGLMESMPANTTSAPPPRSVLARPLSERFGPLFHRLLEHVFRWMR